MILDSIVLLKQYRDDIYLAKGETSSLIDHDYLNTYTHNSDFIIYPIPAYDFIIIESKRHTIEPYIVALYNSIGQLLRKEFVFDSRFRFDLSSIKPGIYFISTSGSDLGIDHFKVIIH